MLRGKGGIEREREREREKERKKEREKERDKQEKSVYRGFNLNFLKKQKNGRQQQRKADP